MLRELIEHELDPQDRIRRRVRRRRLGRKALFGAPPQELVMKLVKANDIRGGEARGEVASSWPMLDNALASEVGQRLAYRRWTETEFVRKTGCDQRTPPTEPTRCGITSKGAVGDRELIAFAHQDTVPGAPREAALPERPYEARKAAN